MMRRATLPRHEEYVEQNGLQFIGTQCAMNPAGMTECEHLQFKWPAKGEETNMNAVLNSGKEVRGVNSGRGLQGAAFDFNVGELGSRENPNHMHTYLGMFPEGNDYQFICSQVALTADEVMEAAGALADSKRAKAEEMLRLRAELLGPDGDAQLLAMQGNVLDSNTAPRAIAMAILGIPPHSSEGSWAEVKAEVQKLRQLEKAR